MEISQHKEKGEVRFEKLPQVSVWTKSSHIILPPKMKIDQVFPSLQTIKIFYIYKHDAITPPLPQDKRQPHKNSYFE